MSETYTMRPCRNCGSTEGVIRITNGQACVWCVRCRRFNYNAPKTETGAEPRSVTTVHEGIKPKQRSKILERDLFRCVSCGKTSNEVNLHVGHMVSVKQGLEHGLTEAELNADENLVTQCEECNLGQGVNSLTLRLMLAVLKMRSDRLYHISDFVKNLHDEENDDD